jgi:hypothetical protein
VPLDDPAVHFCEDEPCLDGCLEPEFIRTNCIVDRCDLEALAVARAEAEPVESGAHNAGIKAATLKTSSSVTTFYRLPPLLNPARTGCLLLDSVEVPALRFNDVDVQVGNIDVTCAQALRR